MISFLAAAVSYILMSNASSLSTLFLSRIPILMHHTLLSSRSYVASKSRANSGDFSLLNICFGIGVFLGPLVGAWMVELVGIRGTILLSGMFSLLASLLVHLLMLDDTFPSRAFEPSPTATSNTTTHQSLFSSRDKILNVMKKPRIRWILTLKTLIGFSGALFHAMTSLILLERFNLDHKSSGWIMSLNGFLLICGQLMLKFIGDDGKLDMIMIQFTTTIIFFSFLVRSRHFVTGTYSCASCFCRQRP